MELIATPAAPTARGHYSQAVVHAGLIYVAGQLPIDPANPASPPGDFEQQAARVLDNVEAILEAAGSSLARVLKATVYITDIAHWSAFNALYAARMGAHRPARTVVPVPLLHYGYLVEVDVVAAAG